jgi:hypothetical protein
MSTVTRMCKTTRSALPIRKYDTSVHARRWQLRPRLTAFILNPNDAKGFRENFFAVLLFGLREYVDSAFELAAPSGAAVVSEAD